MSTTLSVRRYDKYVKTSHSDSTAPGERRRRRSTTKSTQSTSVFPIPQQTNSHKQTETNVNPQKNPKKRERERGKKYNLRVYKYVYVYMSVCRYVCMRACMYVYTLQQQRTTGLLILSLSFHLELLVVSTPSTGTNPHEVSSHLTEAQSGQAKPKT